MAEHVRLVHCIHQSRVPEALNSGLKAASAFPDLDVDLRRGIVYCWLRREDDKMSQGGQRADHVYLEVTVERERCVVADMEWSSLAMMYEQGRKVPRNLEASRLLSEVYRVTAVPLAEYREGMFWTPEVLVKGDISPACIRLSDGSTSVSKH